MSRWMGDGMSEQILMRKREGGGLLAAAIQRPPPVCSLTLQYFGSFATRMTKYEVLGVRRSATLQEIKGAYQAAALATHPDKQTGLSTEVLKNQVCVGHPKSRSRVIERWVSTLSYLQTPEI